MARAPKVHVKMDRDAAKKVERTKEAEARAKRDEAIIVLVAARHKTNSVAQQFQLGSIGAILRKHDHDKRLAGYFAEIHSPERMEYELKQAYLYQGQILSEWREGKPGDMIAKKIGLPPRVIRVAIYVALREGKAGGVFTKASAA